MPRCVRRVIYRFWHEQSERGKVGYIGKDSYHPSRYNLAERSKNSELPKLFKALQKYPIDLWFKEVLESGFRTHRVLVKAEIKWIAKFNSKAEGYNCTDGGEGAVGNVHTQEYKKFMSEVHRWKPSDPKEVIRLYVEEKLSTREVGIRYGITHHCVNRFLRLSGVPRRKRGVSNKGRISPFRGIPRHPDVIKKMSENHLWKPERPQDLVDLYKSGWTVKKLSVEYGVAFDTMKRVLIANGITLNPSAAQRLKERLSGGNFVTSKVL